MPSKHISLVACGASAPRALHRVTGVLALAALIGLGLVPQTLGARAESHLDSGHLGRGVNLTGLESTYVPAGASIPPAQNFSLVREAGFDTVRLPVRWSAHALAKAPYTIDPDFFRVVDRAIANARSHGLNIVVDMHHYRQLDGDRLDSGESYVDAAIVDDRFVAMWGQIAKRYQSQPLSVLFELYNEPHNTLGDGRWNHLLAKALAEVRKTNPRRWVVIGPGDYNKASALRDLQLPSADQRIIVGVHSYEPFYFTMQGAEWIGGSSAWLGTTCCSKDQVKWMTSPLDTARAWARAEQRPVFVGEFGSYYKGALASRATYTRILRDEMERRGMSWAYWEFDQGFGIYDRQSGQWIKPLRDALVGHQRHDDAALTGGR